MRKDWKSINIVKDVYKIVRDKQAELIVKNNGNHIELSYVAEQAILSGINNVDLPQEKI